MSDALGLSRVNGLARRGLNGTVEGGHPADAASAATGTAGTQLAEVVTVGVAVGGLAVSSGSAAVGSGVVASAAAGPVAVGSAVAGRSGVGLAGDGFAGDGPAGDGPAGVGARQAPDLDFGDGFASDIDLNSVGDGGSRPAGAGRAPNANGKEPARRPLRAVRPVLGIPVLGVLVAAGVVLLSTIGGLVSAAIYTATGAAAAASPLAMPAPPVAGGLRQHYEPLRNPETLQIIGEFMRRFTVFSGTDTGEPTGLYREPATIDPISDQPGWVQYLGFNSSASLGSPGSTVNRLMADLIQTSAPATSWRADPGARGGSTRCAIAVMLGTTVSVCAWATEHNVGALLSPTSDTRGNELAVLTPLMRLDLQPG